MTALVVKVLSLVAERQTDGQGARGRLLKVVPEEEIHHPVRYLMSVQQSDGSFRDPEPVLHRHVLVRHIGLCTNLTKLQLDKN